MRNVPEGCVQLIIHACSSRPPQLVYSSYSKETLGLRELQLSVLSAESLRENYFLGGITLRLKDFDLSKETVNWYKLTAVPHF